MPVTKNAYKRFVLLDKYMSGKKLFNRKELRDKMIDDLDEQVSESTIDKDIKFLRDHFGAPIESKGGYHYTDKSFSLAKMNFTDEQLRALEFAAGVLGRIGNVTLAQEAQTVLNKISRKVNEGQPGPKVISSDMSLTVKGVEWLDELYTAIVDKRAILIEYNSHSKNKVTRHSLSPYLLKEYRGLWYVIGYSAEKEFTAVLALDRIKDIRAAHVNYFVDPKFDSKEYFRHSIGITHRLGYKPEKVKFWVDKEAYYYLEIQPLHSSQRVLRQDEEGYTLQLEVILSEELLITLMGLGGRVKVLAPAGLVNEIKGHLGQMQIHYSRRNVVGL
jgi:predicted DNA-binding transcriptional regulator YafY